MADGTRLSGDASKQNPVIALTSEVHAEVSKKQIELGTDKMKPINSIETNAQILRDVGIDPNIVADLEGKSKAHYESLCK